MARRSLACLIAIAGAAAGQSGNNSDSALRQAGVCSRCHVAQVLEWSASKHVRAAVVCQSCHGASAGHVQNERNQVKPDRLPQGPAVAGLCASCHQPGCPKTKQTADCQSCHHQHALVNPAPKPLAPLAAATDPARPHLDAGERMVAAGRWREARAHFESALKAAPGHRRARARLAMVERRLRPQIDGFEIVGARFDPESGLPLEVRVPSLGLPMLLVPGGDADIGSDSLPGSKPAHTVRLAPFYLGKREVTQREWERLEPENPSVTRGADLPVHNVSWDDAQRWIAKIPGAGFRLPTEAEWEAAARAERAPVEEAAWYRGNTALTDGGQPFRELDAYAPRAAGGKAPNALGFHDLRGNVWEWCSSLMRPYPYDAADGRESPSGQGLRVLRGGGYADSEDFLHPSLRHGERASRRNRWNGFRLARSVPPL